MKTNKEYKKRRILGLIVGILLVGFGIYRIPNILINKSDLVQVQGTLDSARTYISLVFTYNKWHTDHSTSRKSELIFFLKESKQKYYLTENISDHYIDDKHETILKGLRESEGISIWIEKKEVGLKQPQIFQIDNEKTTLFDFKSLHIERDPISAVLLIQGSFLVIVISPVWFCEKLNH